MRTEFSVIVGVLILATLTAGCLGAGGYIGDSIVSTSEQCLTDQVPNRSTVPNRSVMNFTVYPEPPTEVNKTSVTNFVIGVERAYERNRLLSITESERLSAASVDVKPKETKERADGYRVTVRTHVSYRGSFGIGMDVGPSTYFVNDTILFRHPPDGTTYDRLVVAEC